MTSGNNNTQKFKAAEWRGYVKRALEDLGGDMKEIKGDLKTLHKRITGIQIKVAGIGAAASLGMTILILLLREIIFK